jgi:hypothetical protein
MNHEFTFSMDFTNDEDVITHRVTNEMCTEDGQLDEVVAAISSFLTNCYGYKVALDYTTEYSKG